MAGKISYSDTHRNAASDGAAALYNSGPIKIYAGTFPANTSASVAGNTLLGTLSHAADAYGDSAAGVATAAAIAAAFAVADGVANFARKFKSDGVTVLQDLNIGNQVVTLTAGAALNAVGLTVSALSKPLYAGQDLWFRDATDGTLKKASVTVNALAGATAVTVSALAAALANNSVTENAITMASPSIATGVALAITADTITTNATAP